MAFAEVNAFTETYEKLQHVQGNIGSIVHYIGMHIRPVMFPGADGRIPTSSGGIGSRRGPDTIVVHIPFWTYFCFHLITHSFIVAHLFRSVG